MAAKKKKVVKRKVANKPLVVPKPSAIEHKTTPKWFFMTHLVFVYLIILSALTALLSGSMGFWSLMVKWLIPLFMVFNFGMVVYLIGFKYDKVSWLIATYGIVFSIALVMLTRIL